MSIIDKQRIAAVRTLEALGYVFRDEWNAPAGQTATAEADAMHVLLVLRADQLEGCTENSEEARELAMIAEVLEAHECKRWPDGRALPSSRLRSESHGRRSVTAEKREHTHGRLRQSRSGCTQDGVAHQRATDGRTRVSPSRRSCAASRRRSLSG